MLCLFIGGSGIGYVWQKNQIDELGQQIKKREVRLSELQRQNKLGRDTLALLRSPKRLIEQVKELKLGLGPPEPAQIRTLIELPPAPESTNSTEKALCRKTGALMRRVETMKIFTAARDAVG